MKRPKSVSRRRVLGGLAAVTAAPYAIRASSALAEETIGNYPAGVQGSTAFVGVSVPLTGAYSSDGADGGRASGSRYTWWPRGSRRADQIG